MTNQKSLIRQLIEAKQINNEYTYEIVYEEIIMSIETLCNSLTKDDINKESIMMMSNLMKSYSKALEEYAVDL